MTELQQLRAEVREAESMTAAARAQYFAAVLEAHEGGRSLEDIARELSLSRQRVHQLVNASRRLPTT